MSADADVPRATGAICGGGVWSRRMARCPVCRARRRFLVRLVMGGYGSDEVCGGCGTWWQDMETAGRPGKREAERNRALVKAEWPKAAPYDLIFKEVRERHGG